MVNTYQIKMKSINDIIILKSTTGHIFEVNKSAIYTALAEICRLEEVYENAWRSKENDIIYILTEKGFKKIGHIEMPVI